MTLNTNSALTMQQALDNQYPALVPLSANLLVNRKWLAQWQQAGVSHFYPHAYLTYPLQATILEEYFQGTLPYTPLAPQTLAKLSRPLNQQPQKVAFLDRDNTINFDRQGYCHRIDMMHIIPKAYETIAKLQQDGYLICLVSNQSGIDRGQFKHTDVFQVMQDLNHDLASQHGAEFDLMIFGAGKHIDFDPIRKPNVGAYEILSKFFTIDLENSIMVGDSIVDIEFAMHAGIPRVFKINMHTSPYFIEQQSKWPTPVDVYDADALRAKYNSTTQVIEVPSLAEVLDYLDK